MLGDVSSWNHASAEEFVSVLQRHAERSRAVEHPLLDAMRTGGFRDLRYVLTAFLREYYVYSRRFTQYLSAVMSKLEDPRHRAQLMPNAMEEGGHISAEQATELHDAGLDPDEVGAPHPELFARFLGAIGSSERDLQDHRPHLATMAWTTTFDAICRLGTQEQAIGALGIATEGIVRHIYLQLLQGIRAAWPELTSRERAFFELHAMVDDEHAEVMRGIAVTLCHTTTGRRQLAVGALQALNARASFFDDMLGFLREVDSRQEPAA